MASKGENAPRLGLAAQDLVRGVPVAVKRQSNQAMVLEVKVEHKAYAGVEVVALEVRAFRW